MNNSARVIGSFLLGLAVCGGAEAAQQCVVSIGEGDQLRGRLEKIADGVLTLRPTISPETVLSIELERIRRVVFAKPTQAKPSRKGDVLKLRNGSRLCGKFVKLTDKFVHFKFESFAALEFSRDAVEEISKDRLSTSGAVAAKPPPGPASRPRADPRFIKVFEGLPPHVREQLMARGGPVNAVVRGENRPPAIEMKVAFGVGDMHHVLIFEDGVLRRAPLSPGAPRKTKPPPRTEARPDHFVLVTERGDRLIGDLSQQADGTLVLSGGVVEAKLPCLAAARIIFPSAPAPRASSGEGGLVGMVSTLAGSSLVVGDMHTAEEDLSLVLLDGQRVSIPLDQVARLDPTAVGELSSKQCILVWGCYSNRRGQFRTVVDILKERFRPPAQIIENFSDRFDAPFRYVLLRSRALVIPPTPKWDRSRTAQLAAQFNPLAQTFLNRGGNIVILAATAEQIDFLREAGLLDVKAAGRIGEPGITVWFGERGRKLAKGIGDGFHSTGLTYLYNVGAGLEGSKIGQFGEGREMFGAPIVVRKVGRGSIILLGMDYSESTEQKKKLLINAVTYR